MIYPDFTIENTCMCNVTLVDRPAIVSIIILDVNHAPDTSTAPSCL